MQAFVSGQWIGSSWGPSASGHGFKVPSRLAPFGPRGPWPRAAAEDLDAALAAAAGAADAWRGLGRTGRLAFCEAALEALERRAFSGELSGSLAAGLGCGGELVAELLAEELLRAREALELARDGGPEQRELGLFAAHWSDRVGLLFARLVGRLAGGARLVLLADARLPEAALALAQAFHAADLPPGVLALLFDDGRTLLRAARTASALSFVRECSLGPAETAQRAAFGAGLTRWTSWPLVSAVHVVPRGADPAREAESVLDLALGPCRTLYGQFPGSIGRILCHSRVFASFSAELLARLETQPDRTAARAPVEQDLCDWLDEAWSLGLDEGAAPIFGEAPEPAAGDTAPVSRRAPRRATPMLFTNVDPTGRLIALARPAPLLRLVRTASDAEADELARHLTHTTLSPHERAP